jgi:hypothetical protein
MLIRTGSASVEVDSLEPAVAQVRALAARVGGYVANASLAAGREQVRAATLELRVPAARFDELVGGLAPFGRVERVDVQAEDVGEEFVDVTARVGNARRLEARLVELLARRTGSSRRCSPWSASWRACARRSSATRGACATCARGGDEHAHRDRARARPAARRDARTPRPVADAFRAPAATSWRCSPR